MLLLCCALPDEAEKPLSMAQFQELSKRVRALGLGGADPLREVGERDLTRLGYDAVQCARMVRLLARREKLERYLRAAQKAGIVPLTRVSAHYPQRLRQALGQRCPAVLFAKGDVAMLAMRCVSVVGSRELPAENRAFAAAAGRQIAVEGFCLCSGGAVGADTVAQRACQAQGGRAVIFPAGRLEDCPARADTLYLAEQAFDAPFSAARALARNYFIHAMGEKTLVAHCRPGVGGTWDGTTENLRRGLSPVFVYEDGSDAARALVARGATAVQKISTIEALEPAQLHF